MLNRRTLLKAGVSALPLASKGVELTPGAEEIGTAPSQPGASTDIPWQQRIRRIGN